MFFDVDKYCSKFETNFELYELLDSALGDYFKTYDISCLSVHTYIGLGKKACSISLYIKSASIKSFRAFCLGFKLFLDTNSNYSALADLPFELSDLRYSDLDDLPYRASFWYSDPFESDPSAPAPEGGEG